MEPFREKAKTFFLAGLKTSFEIFLRHLFFIRGKRISFLQEFSVRSLFEKYVYNVAYRSLPGNGKEIIPLSTQPRECNKAFKRSKHCWKYIAFQANVAFYGVISSTKIFSYFSKKLLKGRRNLKKISQGKWQVLTVPCLKPYRRRQSPSSTAIQGCSLPRYRVLSMLLLPSTIPCALTFSVSLTWSERALVWRRWYSDVSTPY